MDRNGPKSIWGNHTTSLELIFVTIGAQAGLIVTERTSLSRFPTILLLQAESRPYSITTATTVRVSAQGQIRNLWNWPTEAAKISSSPIRSAPAMSVTGRTAMSVLTV